MLTSCFNSIETDTCSSNISCKVLPVLSVHTVSQMNMEELLRAAFFYKDISFISEAPPPLRFWSCVDLFP